MDEEKDDKRLSTTQAANIAGKSERTIRKAVYEGKLPATQFNDRYWEIWLSDLRRWMATPEYHKPGLKTGQKISRKPKSE